MNERKAIRMLVRFVLMMVVAASHGEPQGSAATSVLQPVLHTLDQFMMAGKDGDAKLGARYVDMYDWSPKKAVREIGAFFEDHESVFKKYVSISSDIYGYEVVENGFKGPNIDLEGGVETVDGLTAEFSARLVYRNQRWLILSFEID